jgi:hypothetical protein
MDKHRPDTVQVLPRLIPIQDRKLFTEWNFGRFKADCRAVLAIQHGDVASMAQTEHLAFSQVKGCAQSDLMPLVFALPSFRPQPSER